MFPAVCEGASQSMFILFVLKRIYCLIDTSKRLLFILKVMFLTSLMFVVEFTIVQRNVDQG